MEDLYDAFKEIGKVKRGSIKTNYKCLYCNENVYYSYILDDVSYLNCKKEIYICNNGCLRSTTISSRKHILNARDEKDFFKALRELKKRNINFEDIINKDKPPVYYLRRTKNKKLILKLLMEKKDAQEDN